MKDIEKVRVVILTSNYRIMGEISIPRGARLTDHIAGSKNFFAVTSAEVADRAGEHIMAAPFLDVHRDRVEVIIPDDGTGL